MLKQHILAFLAALCLPIAASASAVVLGPEVPVSSQVDIHPASGLQDYVKVASNGRDFLAVWTDLRIQGWGSYADIFATRIGTDGQPADRFGRRLGPASSTGPNPQIASDGHDYVAVWAVAEGGIRSMHLDENGAPLGDAQLVALADWPVALVFSGSHYLLVGQTALTLLDRDGSRIRTAGNNGGLSAVGAGVRPDGAFAVVYRTPQPMIRTISADGAITDTVVPLWPSDAVTAAAFSPGAVLMVSRNTSSYALVGYDGRVIQPVTPMVAPDEKDGLWAAAAWDGHEFIAVFPPGKTYRIAATGALLDAAPFTFSPGVVSRPAFATAGGRQLAVWSDGELNAATNPELAGRAVADFDALAVAAEPTTLTYSGTAQRGLRIAQSAAGIFGVWTDDRLYGAWAAFNGRQFALDKTTEDWIDVPVVTAGPHSFLVVWRYTDLKSEDALVAQRFDTNGNALDAEPFEVGDEDLPEFWSHQPPSVTFEGSAFRVAWTNSNAQRSVRVGESGQPFDEQRIAIVAGSSSVAAASPLALAPAGARTAAIAWDGGEYVLIWTEGAPGEAMTLRGIRLNAQLTAIGESFDIAGDLGPYAPTIIPSATGVLIGYSRVDAANGFAPRAFTRALQRSETGVRRRPAR